jgi:hypothetical protein
MEDRFVATFTVEMVPEEVWRLLHQASPLSGEESAAGRLWLPGFEGQATVLEAEPFWRLRLRKDHHPCAGSEIIVTLESAGSGARVTVVQSGFGALFDVALDALQIGWSHIVADLALYLRRGVAGGRHTIPWALFGCTFNNSDEGLQVAAVFPGSYAARAGIEPGDILLSAGGAPIVERRELETVMRIVLAGELMEARWVRGREIHSATPRL